ncbi:glutamate--tRNA ligase [Gemmatimonadota bacterium]
MSNVPKQILLFRALEMPVPEFAHLPLILGQDGKRLSKRHGATAVGEYREKGYLAEAVVNFLSLLGWSPKDDREFLRRDELIDLYTLEGVNKKPAAFDESKLEWLNGQYMNLLPSRELLAGARASFEEAGYETAAFDDVYMNRVVDLLKERVRLFTEFGERGGFFFRPPEAYDPEAVGKRWKDPQEVIRKLKLVEERLTALPDWNEAGIEGVIRALAEEEEVGAGQFIHPVRVALTGIHTGPGLFELIELIGSEESVSRLISAIEFLSQREG